MKNILIFYCLLLFVSAGCSNYLDIKPKGQVIPKSLKDYDMLLMNITSFYIEEELFLTADDFVASAGNLGDLKNPNNSKYHLYTFSKERFANPNLGVEAWNAPYRHLYVLNKVINEVGDADNSIKYTAADRKRIEAEARYGRALNYFFLVNMFCKHYNSADAATDRGVPLIYQASVSAEAPPAASVAQVYAQIVKDLTFALKYLPEKRIEVNRPSKGAGYALLARVRLYQGNYAAALKNADLALQAQSALSDYTAKTVNLTAAYAKEQYTNITFGYYKGFTGGVLAPETIALFDPKDLRITKIAGPTWDYTLRKYDSTKISNGYRIEPNLTPSVAEMYLTAAECYARKGATAEAVGALNKVRKRRIPNVANKQAADFGNADALLAFVLEERRRELLMNGTRLFDLKRLNLDARFAKTVKHPLNNKVYEASPNSAKLVLPIPAQVKKFNGGL